MKTTLVVLCILSCSQLLSAVETLEDAKETLARLGIVEKHLREILESPEMWDDPNNKDTLREALQIAGALKLDSLVPALASHISYHYREQSKRELPVHIAFPVAGALVQMGFPAVPHLMRILREVDVAGVGRQRALATYALVTIYEKSGFGREMARHRIELEIAEADEKQQERLRAALESPLLKDPIARE